MKLLETLRPFRQAFVQVGLLSLCVNALMLMPSLYMLQIYDRVMLSRNELTLVMSSLLLLLVLGLVWVLEVVRSRILVRSGIRLDQSLSTPLFQASLDAQLTRVQANPTQVFNDLTNVRQFLTGNGVFAFFDAPWFVIYIGVLFLLHPWLGWLGLACAAVLLSLAWISHQMTAGAARDVLETSTMANLDQQSKLRNAEVIEAMGMLPRLQASWWKRYEALALAQYRVDGNAHTVTAISKFFRYTQQSLSLGAGALLVIQGEISPGAMIVANMLMSRALQPLDLLVSTWRPLWSALSAWTRVQQLLEAQPPQRRGDLTQVPFGRLDLQDVSAFAPGREQPILDHVSLQIPAGNLLCILGPSGSGKSTLARVMLGIWPHVRGEVLLDSAPLTQWRADTLGANMGYLPQDVELMDGTLAQNIARMGIVDSPRVIEAATTAGIHDMVLRFPKGYDSPAGEVGHLLSAGQRQRLALARSLYGNPAVLILDEPNAHLDEAGEMALLETLKTLKSQGKTVILITHRMSVVQLADSLLVLQAGRVQHVGSRDDVLAELKRTAAPAVSA
jgi:ATP-binding cassette subfamily C exporter for protease/lipase